MKEQGLFHSAASPEPVYSDTISLDLARVEPSLAGPGRPQDRVALRDVPRNFQLVLPTLVKPTSPIAPPWGVRNHWEAEGGQPFGGATAVAAPPHRSHVDLTIDGTACKLHHGSVVIAAITSCTNTSNPSVMLAAGLVAKKAVERGLTSQPWVKTSLAPGSKVVTDYLQQAGLMRYLEQLRFHLVGYGCTTCIGNSGPLPEPVSAAVAEGELVVCAVLSGNRNFEGRIQQEVRANYLASPPLVVADALADHGHPRRSSPVPVGRQHHHGPHLARGLDPQDQPGRDVPHGAGGGPEGLQLLRFAPGQPRSDGARHVRERTTQEPAGAGDRGTGHAASPGRRADDDLRRVGPVPGRKCAAARDRRERVWGGVVAGLGGEGPQATRRARRDRAELRAHSPLEPRGHGHSAAAIPAGRDPGDAGAHRERDLPFDGSRRLAHRGVPARQGADRHGATRRRDERPVAHAGTDRYAAGAAVLPARRGSPVRPATAGGGAEIADRPYLPSGIASPAEIVISFWNFDAVWAPLASSVKRAEKRLSSTSTRIASDGPTLNRAPTPAIPPKSVRPLRPS